MTDVQAIKQVSAMKRLLLRELTKCQGSAHAHVMFWVLTELAVQSGIALFGHAGCLEKISLCVNHIIKRDENNNKA